MCYEETTATNVTGGGVYDGQGQLCGDGGVYGVAALAEDAQAGVGGEGVGAYHGGFLRGGLFLEGVVEGGGGLRLGGGCAEQGGDEEACYPGHRIVDYWSDLHLRL